MQLDPTGDIAQGCDGGNSVCLRTYGLTLMWSLRVFWDSGCWVRTGLFGMASRRVAINTCPAWPAAPLVGCVLPACVVCVSTGWLTLRERPSWVCRVGRAGYLDSPSGIPFPKLSARHLNSWGVDPVSGSHWASANIMSPRAWRKAIKCAIGTRRGGSRAARSTSCCAASTSRSAESAQHAGSRR